MTEPTEGRSFNGRDSAGSSHDPAPIEGGRPLVRVTVNLAPRAVEALDLACTRTRDTKTDTINRALVVYNVVLGLIERGGGQLTLQTKDGKTETVHLI